MARSPKAKSLIATTFTEPDEFRGGSVQSSAPIKPSGRLIELLVSDLILASPQATRAILTVNGSAPPTKPPTGPVVSFSVADIDLPAGHSTPAEVIFH